MDETPVYFELKLLETDHNMIDYELLEEQLAAPPVSVNIIEESVDDYLEDDNDVEEDVLADLTFDSHALAEVVIDNPEEVVNNQIILEPMDIGDAIFDIFL